MVSMLALSSEDKIVNILLSQISLMWL